MKPFVKELVWLYLMPTLSDLPSPYLVDSELNEGGLDYLIHIMQQLDFDDPRIKKKVEDIAKSILIIGQPSQNRQQTRKRK